jgi:heme-degrading monooxygenase HmoA
VSAGGGHRVTAEPPYYAVIFTSVRSKTDDAGYAEAAARMMALAEGMDGFLGVESAREGLGITVSYWRDLASIKAWKAQADHLAAQAEGRQSWYDAYRVRIAKVERDYDFVREGAQPV